MNHPRHPLPHQQQQQDDHEAWLEYIRAAGRPAPSEYAVPFTQTTAASASTSRSTSASSTTDRKRRHAGPSPERRGYPFAYPLPYQQPVTGRRPSDMSAASPSGSRGAPIDLTASSAQQQRPYIPRHQSSSERMRTGRAGGPISGGSGSMRHTYNSLHRPGSMSGARRDSDFVPPRWQPDNEVTKCPVCQTDFHIFYRKHHCRKCGRVVCAACSPHRITIPRQYIVRPPNGGDGEESAGAGLFAARNLGGGENVRVCNPCVPDPWTPENAAGATPGGAVEAPQRTQEPPRRRDGELVTIHQPDRYRGILPPVPRREDSNGRTRAHTHQPVVTHSRSMPRPSYVQDPTNANRVPIYQPPGPPMNSSTTRHRHSQSQNAATASSSTQPIPPRRQVREEDECPVCGTELPPNESVREAHVQECISARFSTSTPTTAAPTFPPPTGPSSSTPPVAMASDELGSRPRATSYRPRGMAIYRATEKDCLDENGDTQECIICFEDFQPGEELGRLECWCKFHRLCIRRWWERGKPGGCPTHVLHE
jgi:hypothetical protein